jgi:hypothetical protein
VATIRTLLLMFVVPPGLLILYANYPFGGRFAFWIIIALTIAIGAVGVQTAPWSGKVKGVVGGLYAVFLLASLPFQVLIAACTAGDCL